MQLRYCFTLTDMQLTQVYSEDQKCEFPKDLGRLTKYLSLALGFTDFQAEAAIVNYYNLSSTLSGHQDRSEINQKAPLFSIRYMTTIILLLLLL
jgi:alkylated DNA repair dioxygenase AlkB